jgi:DNA-binding NarL/FixJ family response regulator
MFVIASADSQRLDRWRAWLGERAPLVEIRRAEALLECMLRLQPPLLLLDLRLQRTGVLQDIEQFRKVSPGTRIVALAAECSEDHELALFQAGVRGLCALDVSATSLLKAVDAVLVGELWIRRALVPRLLEISSRGQTDSTSGSTGRFAVLTPREAEITRLIAQGASNKHIARHLAITERTVKNHLTMIFRKTGVVDRLKLAILAVRRRWDPDLPARKG